MVCQVLVEGRLHWVGLEEEFFIKSLFRAMAHDNELS